MYEGAEVLDCVPYEWAEYGCASYVDGDDEAPGDDD